MNVTEQVNFAKSNSYNDIVNMISDIDVLISQRQSKFESSPSQKTAKLLTESKLRKEFLETSLSYTEEYKNDLRIKTDNTCRDIIDCITDAFAA